MGYRISAVSTGNWRPRSWFTSRRLSGQSARSSLGAPIGRRSSLNDTARHSHRLHPCHLVDRHMGGDGTSTLAVAPRGHYCGGGDISHCRVVSKSFAIKPGIPMTSSVNDFAASLFSRALTGFVGATAAPRGLCGESHWDCQRW